MRATIIISSHNEGELLTKTVESCIESSADLDYEIILADDASTDGSPETVERRFPPVRLHRHPTRQGASPTKHLGARHARGEVLLFLDGHSKPEHGSLLQLVRDVEETEKQAVITPRILALDVRRWQNMPTQVGHGYAFDLQTLDCWWVPVEDLQKASLGRGQFYESPALIGCAFAVSRTVYEKVWGFDAGMRFWGVEDLDFALKCWLMGHPILHEPDAAVGHRFQELFDCYSVPIEHIVVNQLRLAYKNYTHAVWSAWLDAARERHRETLPENPEGLWARAWELFKAGQDSAQQERSYLHARRPRDEFWYAKRFGLSWPQLTPQGKVAFAPFPMGASPSPSPSPPPVVLQIVDRKTGNVVTNTTITKIVGQKIQLQVRSQPAAAVSNIQWTIPGQRIKNYTQSLTTAIRTDLAAVDLQNADVDFYWIGGGNFMVQVAATVGGRRLTANVTCDVLAPTGMSMTSVTGTVAVSDPGFGSGLELHFGTSATPGIMWTFKATAPAGGAGQIAGTQLADVLRTRKLNNGTEQTFTSGGTFMLDTSLPYAPAVPIAAGAQAIATSNDSPGTPLTPDLNRKTVNDSFQIFFMYKPDGADSIWVTLGELDWVWSGQTARGASPPPNNWGPATGVANSVNPSGISTASLPVWTANVTSITWR